MKTIEELKTICNDAYDAAIKGMENGKDYHDVHNLLLDVARLLAYIAKQDFKDREANFAKAKTILNYAQEIADAKDYSSVYFKIKGKALPKRKEEEPCLDFEPLPEEPVEEEETKIEDVLTLTFKWDDIPTISFDDVAGLEDVKDSVNRKVLMPLKNPSLYEGYVNQTGGGLLLYGPPGTGKTMIAAALAHEINAKFCTIGPSDILSSGVGNSEKRIVQLFKEARSFPCAVIFFDELESITPASTRSSISRQIRSELLRQMQGMESYSKETDRILFLVGASNKPWDIDSAFLRPGRLGTRVYVGLPDFEARKYIIERTLNKIKDANIVTVDPNIDIDKIVEACDGFNGADISNLLTEVQENSIMRSAETNEKVISQEDFDYVLSKITSSVQIGDLEKLAKWTEENNG